MPRKATGWAVATLPPNEAVTAEEGTTAQRSEPALTDGAAVEVTAAERDGDAAAGDRAGDEEQAARPGSTRATATAAAFPPDRRPRRRRNRIDTMLADSRRPGHRCQGEAGRVAAMIEERTGEAFELGEQLTVVGSKLCPGDPAPGYSSGQAVALMQEIADQALPRSMAAEWTDLAYLQLQAGNTAMWFFALAVAFVFLVLAAQYESWSLPLAVILVVPMCLLCAITGVVLAKMDINIFTQIGFIVLDGLACKNAILIVEFAKTLR